MPSRPVIAALRRILSYAVLLLFYKLGASSGDWWGMLMTSTDGGQAWSTLRCLPDGIYGPIRNKPVQLANGDLLCPSANREAGLHARFGCTSDLGLNW